LYFQPVVIVGHQYWITRVDQTQLPYSVVQRYKFAVSGRYQVGNL